MDFVKFLAILFLVFASSHQNPHERRLLHHLLDRYNILERPVRFVKETLPMKISFSVNNIVFLDMTSSQIAVSGVLHLSWYDVNLRWNSSEYDGQDEVRIPPHRIWKPDILMENSADEGFDGTYATLVTVSPNGKCSYSPPGIFKSFCNVDAFWFPFDTEVCTLRFKSWSHPSKLVMWSKSLN